MTTSDSSALIATLRQRAEKLRHARTAGATTIAGPRTEILLDEAADVLEKSNTQQGTFADGIEAAASYVETYDGSELADGIRALAPQLTDARAQEERDLALIEFAKPRAGDDLMSMTPSEVLAAFNAQYKEGK